MPNVNNERIKYQMKLFGVCLLAFNYLKRVLAEGTLHAFWQHVRYIYLNTQTVVGLGMFSVKKN